MLVHLHAIHANKCQKTDLSIAVGGMHEILKGQSSQPLKTTQEKYSQEHGRSIAVSEHANIKAIKRWKRTLHAARRCLTTGKTKV